MLQKQELAVGEIQKSYALLLQNEFESYWEIILFLFLMYTVPWYYKIDDLNEL